MLAHSLRDAGTKKKLAVLVTLDTVSADVITQLKVCGPPSHTIRPAAWGLPLLLCGLHGIRSKQ